MSDELSELCRRNQLSVDDLAQYRGLCALEAAVLEAAVLEAHLRLMPDAG